MFRNSDDYEFGVALGREAGKRDERARILALLREPDKEMAQWFAHILVDLDLDAYPIAGVRVAMAALISKLS